MSRYALFSNYLQSAHSSFKSHSASARRRRLFLEALEDRSLLAANLLSALFLGGAGDQRRQRPPRRHRPLLEMLERRNVLSGVSFTLADTPSSGSHPYNMAVADFNADGHQDLAVAYFGDNTVGVLLGDGHGAFTMAGPYATSGASPQGVAVGDFNGDGDLDLTVTNMDSNSVDLLLGNGSGGLALAGTFSSGGSGPHQVAVGDFNGDAHLDLAVANQFGNTVGVLLGNGSGGFNPAVTYPTGGLQPHDVTLGDFNGDGQLDLAVPNFDSNNVGILLGNGSGGFTLAATTLAGSSPDSATVGEFDGDSHLDLAVANFWSGTVTVLQGDGSGSFTPTGTYSTGGSLTDVPAVGDFNGDGHQDLAVPNAFDDNVGILQGDGSGGFTLASTFSSGGPYPYSVAVGDFNGDGRQDLAVDNYTSDPWYHGEEGRNTVNVLLNTTPYLLSALFLGGAGDQRGTDLAIGGSKAYVIGNGPESQSLAEQAIIARLSLPTTGTGAATPDWQTTWGQGNLFGAALDSGNLYGVGWSYPGDGITIEGSGGTEVKAIAAQLSAANGSTLWATPVPAGFNSTGGTDYFIYSGVESHHRVTTAVVGGNTYLYATGQAQPCSYSGFVLGMYSATGTFIAGSTDPPSGMNFNSCSLPLPGGSGGFDVAALGGSVFVAGGAGWSSAGYGYDSAYRPTLWKYDTSLGYQSMTRDSTLIGDFRGVTVLGGKLYAVGATWSGDVLIERFDGAGAFEARNIVSLGGTDFLTDVTVLNGKLYATGYTNASGNDDIVLLEIDPATLGVTSTTTYGGANADRGTAIQTDGTDLYLVGESRSYTYGGNGAGANDIVLLHYATQLTTVSVDGGGNLLVQDTAVAGRNDSLTVTRSVGNIIVSDSSTPITAGAGATQVDAYTVSVPVLSVTGNIQVLTDGGSDSLTIDYIGGSPIPLNGLTYTAGTQPIGGSDSLTLTGGAFTTGTFASTNANEGTINLTGNGLITYTGLEPMVTTGMTIDDLILTYNGGAETITLTDAAGAAMTIDSPLSESLTFANPGSSLTINAGTGDDIVSIASVDADGPFDAALTINGDIGNDTVNLNADITFATGKNLDVDLTNDATAGDVDAILVGTNANLILAGLGTATLKASKNIALASGSSVTTVNGNLSLEANQQVTSTSGNFIGVDVNNGLVQATGTGSVTVKGKGGNAAAALQYGVQVRSGGDILGGTGTLLTVEGTGGASSGDQNHGVLVINSGSRITSAGANVTVIGHGGGTGTSKDDYGVLTQFSGKISAGVTGNVLVQGFGENAGGASSVGVMLQNFSTITNDGTGTVTVNGTGGTNAGKYDWGVYLYGSTIITSAGGNVLVTGSGGAGAGDNIHGVFLQNGSKISAGGMGSVDVQGTGGGGAGSLNRGVYVQNSIITSSGGPVQVTGIEGGGASGVAVAVENSGSLTTATHGGTLTVIGNSMRFANAVNISAQPGSSVTLRQFTDNVGINLGSATDPIGGPLSLADAELDFVTAGTVQIGNANSGAIMFSANIDRSANTNVNLTTGNGNNIALGTFSLNALSGGKVSLTTSGTGAITTDDNLGTDLTGNEVTLNAGSNGIGSTSNFLRLAADTVVATTSGNGGINLVEADSVTVDPTGLNAGTGMITLGGGTFTLGGSNRINDTADVNVSGAATLALSTNTETIDQLILTDGSVTGTGAGALTGASTFDVRKGSLSVILAGSVGLTKSTMDTVTLSGVNTYGGATTIDNGRLNVNGSIDSNVTVNSTGTLGGTGAVNGTVASTGTIAPGTSAGILNSGSVSLTGGALAVEIGGPNAGTMASDHDQLNVSGTVALGDGVAKLTLAGGYVPVVGDDFVILNNDLADFTTGYLLDAADNPLDEGAAVNFNGQTLFITYNGGDGNDIVLNTSALVNGTDAADSITLTPQAGGGLQYVLNGKPAVTLPGPLATFTFNAQGGDDLMTVNLNSNALPSGGIFYNGEEHELPLDTGANTVHGDVLRVVGTTTQTATYLPNGVVNALLDNDGQVTVAGQGVINFTGLEPVDLQNLAVANVNFPNGADILSIATGLDAATNLLPALVVSGTSGGVGFEQVHLRGNTQVAINTVTGGSDGADSVVFNSVNVAHGNAALAIDTGANSDSISVAPLASLVAVSLTARGSSDGFSGSMSLPASPTTFTNVDVLTGSSSSGDSLTMNLDTATTWSLTGGNAGNVNVTGPANSLAFMSFENLTGAPTAGDTFVIGATASLTGRLDGRGPSGTLVGSDTLDYSAWFSSVAVNLTSGAATAIFGGAAGGLVAGTGSDLGNSVENILSGSGADVLVGDADRNVFRGNSGGDTLNGGANIDNIDGGDQDDIINVAVDEAEFDTLQGGPGYDHLVNLAAAVDVKLNAFNTAFDSRNNGLEEYLGNGARVIGNEDANGLHFGFTKMTNTTGVNSGLGDDGVTTSYHNTSLVAYDGDAGSDQVTLVFTPSQLDALTTADILVVQDYVTSPNLKSLSVTNVPAKGNFTATNFETARLAVYDDGLILDITTCFAQIQTQDQIIRGGDENNLLTGTPLVDLIFGELGDDTINGLDSGDCLFGGAGNDLINGYAGNDLLSGGSGDDSLVGDTGYDWLVGGLGADLLDGGLHDDQLDGGPGQDTVRGGPGYDVIKVRLDEAATDVMNGGDNTDTIVNDMAAPVVLAGFDAGVSSVEGWVGNNQPIVGTDEANVLSFLVAPSYSMSLSGVPYIDGRSGNDTITGTNGVDNLRGGDGNDTLYGLGGVDTLYGDAGDDSLHGGDGVDYLYGGDGVDTITTGAGRDYVYFAGDLNSRDTITDFALYSDTINLQAYMTSYSQLTFTIVAPNTTINLANAKKIRLLNWTRAVGSSQFRF